MENDLSQYKDLPPAKSLALIRSKYPTLAASEARVASWVLQQPESIMHLSMAQVAQACGVSDTTVLRFCRNSGFQGYTDLKLSIARDLTNSTKLIHDDIVDGDTPFAIARKVFMSNILALYDTLEVLDEDLLTQALELLSGAHQILLVGVGTSEPIVTNAYNLFMRLGLNVKAQTDSYMQLMEVALLGPGDVVVGISQSGSSVDPVFTMKQAKQNGVSTICITGNSQSPITEYADVVLLSVGREARAEAIASRIAQDTIIDTLYVIMAWQNMELSVQNEKQIWDALLPKML
jgi:RpiR family transcriptional regulator, carbohydrate utilization regulator